MNVVIPRLRAHAPALFIHFPCFYFLSFSSKNVFAVIAVIDVVVVEIVVNVVAAIIDAAADVDVGRV